MAGLCSHLQAQLGRGLLTSSFQILCLRGHGTESDGFLWATAGDRPQLLEAACSPLACGPLQGCPSTRQLLCPGQRESVPRESVDSVGWKVTRGQCHLSALPYSTGWKQVTGPVHAPGTEIPQKHLPKGGWESGADRPGQGAARESLLCAVPETMTERAMSLLSQGREDHGADAGGSPENT